jgi:hypothetical protein
MSPLPKLKLKLPFGDPNEEICELEQAKDSLNFDAVIFLVEGQRVHSYDKLVQLATQDNYKNKEFIEVELLPLFEGG